MSDDNIHRLRLIEGGSGSDGNPPPNNDVCAALRLLLELAEQGTIQAIGYVAVPNPDATPAVGFASEGKNRNALAMGTAMLQNTVQWHPE